MPIQQVILVLSPFDNSFFLKISGKLQLVATTFLLVCCYLYMYSRGWNPTGGLTQEASNAHFLCIWKDRDCYLLIAQMPNQGIVLCLCWTSLIHFALGSGWKKFLAFIATRCCLLVPFMCRLYFSVPFVRRCLT